MGLDMYLYRLDIERDALLDEEALEKLVEREYDKRHKEARLEDADDQWLHRYQAFMNDKTFNLMDWRKVNAIHDFFVREAQNGVDDCGTYAVSIDVIERLLDRIHAILNNKADPGEVLPTAEGFFFGGTDYDDYYFEELERTYRELKEELKDFDETKEVLVYHSSW